MGVLKIGENISVDENQIKFEYFRSAGPGGQNKNKVHTAVRLRLNLFESGLDEYIIEKIKHIAPSKITSTDILMIEATNHRTRESNRKAAMEKLVKLISSSAIKPKKRKPTKISAAAKEKRLKSKKLRSKTKDNRQKVDID